MGNNNVLINAGMNIAQRGTSFDTGSIFTDSVTVTFSATSNILRTDSISWATQGARVGMMIRISGTSLNNGDYTIASINTITNPDDELVVTDTSIVDETVSTTFIDIANHDGAYTLDRYVLLSDGNDIADVSQDSDAPDGSSYAFKVTVATAAKKFGILQIAERANCRHLVGSNASLSFQAKTTGNAIRNIRAAILSWTGTADAFTDAERGVVDTTFWNAEGVDPTLVANWIYENIPVDLALGTSYQTFKIENICNVAVFIWVDDTDAAVGDVLLLGEMRLVEGATADVSGHRSIGEELTLCQRYFCKSFPYATAPADGTGLAASGDLFFTSANASTDIPCIEWYFPVQMRTDPNVTLYNPRAAGTAGQWDNNSTSGASARARTFNSENKVSIDNTITTLATGTWFIAATADAEL